MHVSRSAWALALIAVLVVIPVAGASPITVVQPTTPQLPDEATSLPVSTDLPAPRSAMDTAREIEDAASRIRDILAANNIPTDARTMIEQELARMERALESAPDLIERVSDPASRQELLDQAVSKGLRNLENAPERCVVSLADPLHEQYCAVDASRIGAMHDTVLDYANDKTLEHLGPTVDWAVVTVWTEVGPVYARCPVRSGAIETVEIAAQCVHEAFETNEPGVGPTVRDARDEAEAAVQELPALAEAALDCADGALQAGSSARCAAEGTQRGLWSSFARWFGLGR